MDINNEQNHVDRDYVCPVCYRPLQPAVRENEIMSADGIRRRSYSCWCDSPDHRGKGHIVIQFYHGGRWRIEKYIEIRPLCVYTSDWRIIQPASEADETPLLQTGPGGDYAVKTTDAQLAAALELYNDLLTKLSSCGHIIRDILLQHRTDE